MVGGRFEEADLPVYIALKGATYRKEGNYYLHKDPIKKEKMKSLNVLFRHPPFYGKDRIENFEERVLNPAKAVIDEFTTTRVVK